MFAKSDWMFEVFEMSASGSNTGTETFTPLIDGVVDKDTLYRPTNQLHFSASNRPGPWTLSGKLVQHDAPDLVLDRIKVWAIRLHTLEFPVSETFRPLIRSINVMH